MIKYWERPPATREQILEFVDLYRPKYEEKENIGDARMQAKKPPSAHVRNASPPINNIVNSSENVKENPVGRKKSVASKNFRPTIHDMSQKQKKAKRPLSAAQLAALAKGRAARAKKLAGKNTPSRTKKNPAKTKTKKTTNSKQLGKITMRKNPLPEGTNIVVLADVPKASGNMMYIGDLPEITYISEAGKNSPRPFKYNHKFSRPYPKLVTDGENLFILKGNKKMHFDKNRGIIS